MDTAHLQLHAPPPSGASGRRNGVTPWIHAQSQTTLRDPPLKKTTHRWNWSLLILLCSASCAADEMGSPRGVSETRFIEPTALRDLRVE